MWAQIMSLLQIANQVENCLTMYGEYFDKTLLQHMFAKMMVAYVDVLGSRAKLGKPCQFEAPELSSKILQYT